MPHLCEFLGDCCSCGGGDRHPTRTSYATLGSACGESIACNYRGGGKCICDSGWAGQGCADKTPLVRLGAARGTDVYEPPVGRASNLQSTRIPLVRSSATDHWHTRHGERRRALLPARLHAHRGQSFVHIAAVRRQQRRAPRSNRRDTRHAVHHASHHAVQELVHQRPRRRRPHLTRRGRRRWGAR